MPDTLRHIAALEVRGEIPWEVIVVDNASSDNTSEVVKEEWSKYRNPIEFKLLYQPIPGLTQARTMAFEHAQYDYILLCDDDNWLAPDYLNIAFDLMQQHPNIGMLGGYGELAFEVEPPGFARKLPLFANGHQAKKSGKVQNNIVYGAGCVMRKSAYDDLFEAGFQPLLSDRVATLLSSGGDYELCYALALTGYDIWYDHRLKFKHFMVNSRLKWSYYLRYLSESSRCFEVLDAYKILTNDKSRSLFSFNLQLFRGFLYYLRHVVLLYAKRLFTKRNSDAYKVNYLMGIAYRARLSGFSRYFSIRRNFLKLLQFKQEKLGKQYRNKVHVADSMEVKVVPKILF